jgi:hypothetical protein
MKRLVALGLVAPATAQAHVGDHSDAGFLHLIGAADHLALIALVVALVACAAALLWSRR